MFFECRCVVCDFEPGPVCAACAARFHAAPPAGEVRASFALDDAFRPVVVALKYRRERRLARWAAAHMAPMVPTLADTITWVPATPDRVAWRGYDQSREIAVELARLAGIPARRLLVRARCDERQTARNRMDRARGPQVHGRPTGGLVVVVDDVVTTGATMATAHTALVQAGALHTVPLVLAATPRWDQGPMRRAEHSSTIHPWTSKSAPSGPKSRLVSRNM